MWSDHLPHWRLASFGFITTILSLGTYGIQNVVLNIPQKLTMGFVNESFAHLHGYAPSSPQLASIWGGVVSVYAAAAVVGALSSSIMVDRVGRKVILMIVTNILVVIGSCFMFLAFSLNVYHLLIVGRLILGFSTGIATTTLPVYLIECSPVRVRGFMASLHGVCSDLTNTITMILTLPRVMGSLRLLPYLFSLQGILALVQMATYALWPESPQYVYVKQKNPDLAKKLLTKIKVPESEIPPMIQEFQREAALSQKQLSWRQIWSVAVLRKALLLGVVIGAARNFCGSAAVHNFSTHMFTRAGIPLDRAQYGTLFSVVLEVFGSGLSSLVVDRVGRKPLLLGCLWSIWGSWIIVVILSLVQHYYPPSAVWTSWTCLVLIVAAFSLIYPLGPGNICWFLAAELVPEVARARASQLGIAVLWSFYVVTVQIYPNLDLATGYWSVVILFVVPLLGLMIILHVYLPETKQRNITEILQALSPKRIADAELEHPSIYTFETKV